MRNTISDEEARAIADDVAAHERARATLREAGNWSPVGVGLLSAWMIGTAIFLVFFADSPELWVQVSGGVAGVWAVAGLVYYWRKYRKLVRAIKVVLARQEP